MRICGGQYRGRKLNTPTGDHIRPTSVIELRNDGRRIGDFKAYNYTIPEGVEVLSIYEP